MLAVAIAAGGSIRLDGTGERCEVPITGPSWVRIGWNMAAANRAATQGWNLAADVEIEGARGGPWKAQRVAVIRRAAARHYGEENARVTEHEHAMNDGEGARKAETLIE